MADNYEQMLNDLSQQAENPQPTVRRRKKRKIPKWQRLLRKYWPPIRFGLIILAAVLLLWFLISGIGGCLFGGEDDPGESTPPPTTTVGTEPSETTDPTSAPTTVPPTVNPLDLAVDESWYVNTLFIGDSRTVGLRDFARIGSADYFCTSGLSVFNFDTTTASDTGFESQTLESLLSTKTYDKIIISLGINECGYPKSSMMSSYDDLIEMIVQAQPNTKIILQGIVVVSSAYADGRDYFTPTHIAEYNAEIQARSNGSNIFYIDINEYITDADGYLTASLTTDGCHFSGEGNTEVQKYINVAIGNLGI